MEWLNRQADKEAKSDELKFSERIGQIIGIAGFFVVMLFVVIHQTRPTGFFTDEFGTGSAAILYFMIVVGVIPMLVRFALGRKNSARPYEILSSIPFIVGSLYFLAVFPFDFAHFADPLPKSLEFSLDWVSATFARWVLALGIIGGSIAAIWNTMLYRAVKERLSKPAAKDEKPPAEPAGPTP